VLTRSCVALRALDVLYLVLNGADIGPWRHSNARPPPDAHFPVHVQGGIVPLRQPCRHHPRCQPAVVLSWTPLQGSLSRARVCRCSFFFLSVQTRTGAPWATCALRLEGSSADLSVSLPQCGFHLFFTLLPCVLHDPGNFLCQTNRYIVTAGDLQATFTGAQQRFGVAILAFLVDGLFGCKGLGPSTETDCSGETSNGGSIRVTPEAVHTDSAGGRAAADAAACTHAATLSAIEDDGDVARVANDYQYDWSTYHRVFKNKPLQDAVTELFAEYAALYARIAGYTRDSVAAPMTLVEARSIQDQATAFVSDFVTPLLGPIFSTKMHKLLFHVLDAIRWHGNLRNCNTSSNEAGHKDDKKYYRRTNGALDLFTGQIVRHAQGTRGVLDAHNRAAGGGATAPAPRPPTHPLPPANVADLTSTDSSSVPSALFHSPSAATKVASGLRRELISTLATRPGLSRVCEILGFRSKATVPVLSRVYIDAQFDCGARMPQLLRSSPNFHGFAWYDAVHYMVDGETEPMVGELRALVWLKAGDHALIREWMPATPSPGCPLTAKGCKRLQWRVRDGAAAVSVVKVKVSNILRLAHVVPDFGELLVRRGLDADPPALYRPDVEHRAMRFFLNPFLPWGESDMSS